MLQLTTKIIPEIELKSLCKECELKILVMVSTELKTQQRLILYCVTFKGKETFWEGECVLLSLWGFTDP